MWNNVLKQVLHIASLLISMFHNALSLWGSQIPSTYLLIEVALWKMENNEDATCKVPLCMLFLQFVCSDIMYYYFVILIFVFTSITALLWNHVVYLLERERERDTDATVSIFILFYFSFVI